MQDARRTLAAAVGAISVIGLGACGSASPASTIQGEVNRVPMQFAQGTATTLELTDVDFGQQNGSERLTFTLQGDDGTAGWRMSNVDAATQDGSGMELDVEGDAIIEVILTRPAAPDPSCATHPRPAVRVALISQPRSDAVGALVGGRKPCHASRLS